jgi:hypothetical protein
MADKIFNKKTLIRMTFLRFFEYLKYSSKFSKILIENLINVIRSNAFFAEYFVGHFFIMKSQKIWVDILSTL